jgi:hypothetical protein
VLLLSASYWTYASLRAAYKPIWYDEALTWHIARLPNPSAIMATLYDGADQNLPLTFFSVRAAHALFGYSEWSTRFPAQVGFWVMLLCLFTFLRRRLPLSCALAGTLFPFVTFAGPYAYEARGYALLLGAAGLALAAWQAAAEDRARRIALPMISFAFAIALSSHYTGALLAIPFGAGEVVRNYQRRKIDWPVWIAFLVPSPLVLFYPKLMAPALTWDVGLQAPTLSSLSMFLGETFYTAVAPLVVASGAGLLTFAALYFYKGSHAASGLHWSAPGTELRIYEIAALAGFMAAPLLFFAAGLGSRHFSFTIRYGLICVIGASGLFAALLAWYTREQPRAATAFVLALAAFLVATRGREAWTSRTPPAAQFRTDDTLLLGALKEGLPVVVVHWNDMIMADFYLPPELMENAYYIRDRKHEREYKVQLQANEVTFRAARHLPWHGHYEDWHDFRRQHSRFLMHAREEYSQWMFDLLTREGWLVTLRNRANNEMLFEVSSGNSAWATP